jgi:hypothetical protein
MRIKNIINLLKGTERKIDLEIENLIQIEHNFREKTPYLITYMENDNKKKKLYYDKMYLDISTELGDKLLLIIFDSIREYKENKGNNKKEFIECVKKIHELKGEIVSNDEINEYEKSYEELIKNKKINNIINENKEEIVENLIKNDQKGGFPFPFPVPFPLIPFLTSFLVEWLGLKLFGMWFIRLLELFIEPIFAVFIKIILKIFQLIGKLAGAGTVGIGLLVSTLGGLLGLAKSLLFARAHTIVRYQDENGVEKQKFKFSLKYLILSIIDIIGAIIALIPVVGWLGIIIKWVIFGIRFFSDLAKLSKNAVEIIRTETNLEIPTLDAAIQKGVNIIIKKGIVQLTPLIKKELIKLKDSNPIVYEKIKNKKNREIIYEKFETIILDQITNKVNTNKKGGAKNKSKSSDKNNSSDQLELREEDMEFINDVKKIVRSSLDTLIDTLIEEIEKDNNTKRIKINYEEKKNEIKEEENNEEEIKEEGMKEEIKYDKFDLDEMELKKLEDSFK